MVKVNAVDVPSLRLSVSLSVNTNAVARLHVSLSRLILTCIRLTVQTTTVR